MSKLKKYNKRKNILSLSSSRIRPAGTPSTEYSRPDLGDFFPIFSSLCLTFHYIWYILSKTKGKLGQVRDIAPVRVRRLEKSSNTVLALSFSTKTPVTCSQSALYKTALIQKYL